jgi:uncharacterized protein YndB with AHSA1/START domain
MTELATLDGYSRLIDPTTLQIKRLLPGPAERIWDYLTNGELRRKWFAAGDMTLIAGAPFELVWRNDELTDPPGPRPEGYSVENRMQSRIIEVDPPHMLTFAWGDSGSTVTFTLAPKGSETLLTIIHRGVAERSSALSFGSGWHAHLDVLTSVLTGRKAAPFWDEIARLRADYAERL